jgi:hypothetical protein
MRSFLIGRCSFVESPEQVSHFQKADNGFWRLILVLGFGTQELKGVTV